MAAFPTGTRKFFKNATAPTGWTKDAGVYNHTLRVVTTSTFGSGGTSNFTDVFNATRAAGAISYPGVGVAATISPAAMDIPAHTHTFTGSTGIPVNSPSSGFYYPAGPSTPPTITGWYGAPGLRTSGTAGTTTGHTHTVSSTIKAIFNTPNTVDTSVKYVDSIICIKA